MNLEQYLMTKPPNITCTQSRSKRIERRRSFQLHQEASAQNKKLKTFVLYNFESKEVDLPFVYDLITAFGINPELVRRGKFSPE